MRRAAQNGAVLGAQLVVAVVANLVVFMGILALADGVLHYFGELMGFDNWSIELFLAYIFYPVAYLIGVNGAPIETFAVARLLGVKLVVNFQFCVTDSIQICSIIRRSSQVNDFIAYKRLGDVLKQGILTVFDIWI